MNVFITGGAGYLGSTMVPYFLSQGARVTVYDNLMYNQQSLLHCFNDPMFNFIYGDVTNSKMLRSSIEDSGADIIIPLAAIVGAPACDANPTLAYNVNFEQIATIIDFFGNNKKIIMPNTNSQYGTSTEIVTEESPINPLSLYARTKCDAERLLSGSNGISLRLATVFGVSPRMRLDLLVNDFVYRAVHDGVLVLFEPNFIRNYIHVKDVARAFYSVASNFNSLDSSVYNIGLSSANLTKLELANAIKKFIPGLVIRIDEYSHDKDKRNYLVSNDKIESTGVWYPKYTIEDGIKELMSAYPIFNNVLNKEYTNL